MSRLLGVVAIVLGATLTGFDPNREVVTLTLGGRHSLEVRDAVLLVAGGRSLHAGDGFGALLVVAGIAMLWRTSFFLGIAAVIPILAGTLLIDAGSRSFDPVFATLPRGGHGLHVSDAVGMALVIVGILALLYLPPPRGRASPA